MQHRLLSWFVILSIVLLPSALAANIIQDVSFEAPQLLRVGEKLYAPPSKAFVAKMQFTLLDPYTEAQLDLSSLSDRDEKPIVSLSSCSASRCSVDVSVQLSAAAQSTVKDVAFTITASDGSTQQLNYRFYLDTVAPKLLGIGTQSCISGCAVPPGDATLIARFTEVGTGMDPERAFLIVDGSPVRATTCTQTTCEFSLSVSDTLTVQLQDTAADYAGNTVGVNPPVRLPVDGIAPVASEPKVMQGTVESPAVITAPFKITFRVTDTTTVVATAWIGDDLEKKITTQCTGGVCSLSMTPPGTPSESTVHITYADAAGNGGEFTVPLAFAGIIDAEGDFWSARVERVERGIDTGAIRKFRSTLHIPVTLSANADATVSFVTVDRCSFFNNEKPLSIPSVRTSTIKTTDGFVIVYTFGPAGPAELETVSGPLRLTCEARIFSVVNGEQYAKAEVEPLEALIDLRANPTVPEKIQRVQEQAQRDLQSSQKTIQKLEQIVGGLTALCAVDPALSSMNTVMRTAGLSCSVLGPLCEPVAKAANKGGDAAVYGKKALSVAASPICAAISCKGGGLWGGWTSKLDSTVAGNNGLFGKTFSAVARVTSPNVDGTGGGGVSSLLDPYRSISVAAATGCVPAIVHHYEQYEQIDCNYNNCLVQEVSQGVPVSVCQAQRGYAQCVFTRGALYNGAVLPAMWETAQDAVLAPIRNPASLVTLVGGTVACKLTPSGIAEAACSLPKAVADLQESVKYFQQVKQGVSRVQASKQACAIAPAPPRDTTGDAQVVCQGIACWKGNAAMIGEKAYLRLTPAQFEALAKEERAKGRTTEYAMYMQKLSNTFGRLAGETDAEYLERFAAQKSLDYVFIPDVYGQVDESDIKDIRETRGKRGYSSESLQESLGAAYDVAARESLELTTKADAGAALSIKTANTREEMLGLAGRTSASGPLLAATLNAVEIKTLAQAETLQRTLDTTVSDYSKFKASQTVLVTAEIAPLDEASANIGRSYSKASDALTKWKTAQAIIDKKPLTDEEVRKAAIALLGPSFDPDTDQLRLDGALAQIRDEEIRERTGAQAQVSLAQQELATILQTSIQSVVQVNTAVSQLSAKDAEKNRAAAQKVLAKAKRAENAQALRKDNKRMVMAMWGAAVRVNQLTSAFGLNKFWEGKGAIGDYQEGIDQVGRAISFEDDFVYEYCSQRNLVERESGILQTTAQNSAGLVLVATRSSAELLDQNNELVQGYQYVIAGKIKSTAQASYKIYLRPCPTSECTGLRVGALDGQGATFLKTNVLYVESTQLFDEACVEFDIPLNQVFSEAAGASHISCAPIREVQV